jgi:hypothetical protein
MINVTAMPLEFRNEHLHGAALHEKFVSEEISRLLWNPPLEGSLPCSQEPVLLDLITVIIFSDTCTL